MIRFDQTVCTGFAATTRREWLETNGLGGLAALCVLRDLAGTYGDATNAKRFKQKVTRAKRSFNEQFWNDAAGCLYDVVNGDERDASIRPNQIFAVSLPPTILTKTRAKQVVAVVDVTCLRP